MIRLPNTDLTVSEICLGTDIAGTSKTEEEFFALLDAFADCGGNFVDTANVYARWLPHGDNCSEKMIGRWLTSRKKPLVVASKGGHPDLRTWESRINQEALTWDIDSGLRALHVDAIDLYYLHRDDPSVPIGEILELMNGFVKEGKIRYFAASNFGTARLQEADEYAKAHGIQGFAAVSNRLGTAKENPSPNPHPQNTMWYCDETQWRYHETSDLPLIPYEATSRGYFAKKAAGTDVSHLESRFRNPENEALLQDLVARSKETGYSVHTLSLVHLIRRASFPLIPVVGVSKQAHIDDLQAVFRLLNE